MTAERVPALVSIGIPTYNRAASVRLAIDSVLAQTYPHIEVVVVDDGSSDATPSVLDAYERDGRIRVVRHARNQGATAAKNSALDAMQGEYQSILDSDDQLLPDAVAVLVSVLERPDAEIGMAFADCVDSVTGVRTGAGVIESGAVSFRDVVTGRVSGEFWGMWRRSALAGRRFDPSLPGGSESLVWHDMYRTTRVYYLRHVVRRYTRGSADSVTRANLEPAQLQRTRRTYERYLEAFGSDILKLEPAAYAKLVSLVALWHLLAGERWSGVRRLIQAVRADRSIRSASLGLCMALTPRVILKAAFDYRYRRSLRRQSS